LKSQTQHQGCDGAGCDESGEVLFINILKRDQPGDQISGSLGHHGEQRGQADATMGVEVDIEEVDPGYLQDRQYSQQHDNPKQGITQGLELRIRLLLRREQGKDPEPGRQGTHIEGQAEPFHEVGSPRDNGHNGHQDGDCEEPNDHANCNVQTSPSWEIQSPMLSTCWDGVFNY